MTKALTCGYVSLLDKPSTLRTEGGARRQPVVRVLGRPFVFRLMTLTLVAGLLIMIDTSSSKADMNLKLYAYNQMSWKEFECYNWLIHKESSWNPKAVSPSGNHFGLGQMRSRWYKDLTPKQQIKAHMRYIDHRYPIGGACAALDHLEKKGWH